MFFLLFFNYGSIVLRRDAATRRYSELSATRRRRKRHNEDEAQDKALSVFLSVCETSRSQAESAKSGASSLMSLFVFVVVAFVASAGHRPCQPRAARASISPINRLGN